MAGQQAQDLERVGGCRGVRHLAPSSQVRDTSVYTRIEEGQDRPRGKAESSELRKPLLKRLGVSSHCSSATVRRLARCSNSAAGSPSLGAAVDAVSDPRRFELYRVAREPPRWSTHGCVQAAPDHHRRRSPVLRGRRRRRAPRRARRAERRGAPGDHHHPRGDRRPRRGHHAALRRLHRLRRPRHAPHPDRQAHPAPAQPHPQPRGGQRSRGRQRGRPRADVPAPLHAGHRPDRRAARDGDRLRADAQRQPHAGRPRVRLARLLRRSRARSRIARWR